MIKDLSISKKLMVLVVLKMVLLAIFASWLLFSKYTLYTNMDQLSYDMELATYVSKLIHETQKERGMTAGYLGSKGKKFADVIKTQRLLTNKRFQEIEQFYKDHQFESNIKAKVDEVLKRLNNLSQIRSQVDSFSIKLGDALKYYTKTNAVMLQMITEISKASNSKIISQEINGYYNFLQAKERVGIERAVGANALSKKTWIDGLKNKYISLIAQQESFINSFLNYSLEEESVFYKNTVKGESIENVNRMRAQLLENNFEADPTVWFKEITSKINLFKRVDDYIAQDLLHSIAKEKSAALEGLILVLVIGIIGWGIVIFFTYIILKDILRKIKTMNHGMVEFFKFVKREKTTAEPIAIDSDDEFGSMAKIVNENIEDSRVLLEDERFFINNVLKATEFLKKGDLNTKLSRKVKSETLERLRQNLNEMFETLRVTVSTDLSKVEKVLEEYRNKNFRNKIDDDGKFAVMINELSDIVNHMLLENKQNGVMLQTASSTLLQNVDQLNDSSNQAAARLEETSAALEEMTSNVRSNTKNIAQINNLANQVTKSATQGLSLANKTTEAMDQINEEVSAINEAIGVIDQIAFQTNILSLNAAVEAATAGEAGKGFAVVAQEVRNLAARSAEAAKDIKDIVEKATAKANNGKAIADNMIEGYNGLTGSIDKTIELIGSVDAASKEQQQGIEQINDAINSLDKQTQENVSIASQTQAIANETSTKANDLVKEADSMEFEGKESIKGENKYTKLSSSVSSKPIVKTSQVSDVKTVVSNTDDSDDWASF